MCTNCRLDCERCSKKRSLKEDEELETRKKANIEDQEKDDEEDYEEDEENDEEDDEENDEGEGNDDEEDDEENDEEDDEGEDEPAGLSYMVTDCVVKSVCLRKL